MNIRGTVIHRIVLISLHSPKSCLATLRAVGESDFFPLDVPGALLRDIK